MSDASNSRSGRGKKRRRHEGNGFEAWGGYMQAKIQKLQEQCQKDQRQKSSNIFSGVSIFVNGYIKPTSAELKQLVLEHGGQYHHYYSRTLVSHIVASNLPNSKVAQLTDEKVMRPDWITDSISAGKLLPYQDYLLYPTHSHSQPHLAFMKHTTAAPSSEQSETIGSDHEQTRSTATTENVSHHMGLRNHPHLQGKPVAVTHSSGKGANRNRRGTDIEYERVYWQKKRESVKGRGKNKMQPRHTQVCVRVEEDAGEGEDVDFEAGQTEDTSRPAVSKEGEFFSMAEIASCSYEARQAGVKNGMLMGAARELCPALVPIPYDFDAYREVSQALYDTVASYTHDIEAVSCDEMLIDCTDVLVDTSATPLQFASLLRQEIREKTQCNASAGIAVNILLAKLSTRKAKPNGQFHLLSEDVAEFIQDKSISDLPGVGRTTTCQLHAMNVHTCAQLQQVAMATLQKEFGPKTGQLLSRLCRGEDDRCVTAEKERKSVSAEINYGIRFSQMSEVEKFLEELAGEVHNRLVKVDRKGKQITVKLKIRRQDAPRETAKFLGHGVCDNLAKSVTLPVATQDVRVIAKECITLVKAMHITPSDFRGMGIQVSRLEVPSAGQQNNRTLLSFVTPVTRKNICHITTSVTTTTTSMQQKLGPVLPPLPKLPDLSSPPAKHMHLSMQQCSYEVNNDVVDLKVLAELPEDIQRQLQKAMTDRQCSKPTGGLVHRSHDSKQPGCSHWPSDQQDDSKDIAGEDRVVMGGERSSVDQRMSAHLSLNSQPIVALPSYSQLDPGCLAALPSDLREELEHAYDQERNKHSMAPAMSVTPDATGNVEEGKGRETEMSNRQRVHPLILEQVKSYNSPKKSPAKSPRRGTRAVRGGVGRGRQRASPKKLQYDRRQKTIEVVSPQKTVEEIEDVNKNVDKEIFPSEAVNLCGAVDISDVKLLLSQWLQSSHSPVESDVEWIAAYLARLVNDLNLEMVVMVMNYLHRQVMKKESHQWLTSYQTLSDHVQAVVCSRYGGMLKLQVT
ncbi:DNA repair protein REV1 [Lamellibrachia satsuma]|nr:DNA repair protein REV1 [Lamellibrachia satsuma]